MAIAMATATATELSCKRRPLMPDYEFEEEEFTTEFSGHTLLRILAQTRPHWRWLVGFLVAISAVALADSYLNYLKKGIVDDGILAGDRASLTQTLIVYAAINLLQSAFVFTFIYLAAM